MLWRRIGFRFGLGVAAAVVITLVTLAMTAWLLAPPGDDEGWSGVLKHPQRWLPALLAGLGAGMAIGLWVARVLTRPLGSMAEAAQRIAQGDLSVRADPGRADGEMADMLRHFNDMAGALESGARERRAMVAAISHELRTPLTVLCARLHAVVDGVVEADSAEFRRLLDQAEHLGRLVDDLNTLTQAEAGRLPLRRETLDLGSLARDVLHQFDTRLAQHGIVSELVLPAQPLQVNADRDRLRQVLVNLIENATRHGAAGGWIQVRVRREGGTAVLVVEDAGGGEPEAVRQHLRRGLGDPARPRAAVAAGSGLGMAIVRMLVHAHEGEVRVEAALHLDRGAGVAIEVRLPAGTSG